LYFAPGSIALTAGQRGYLRALATLARELSPGLTLHVAGHSDARHSERYSLALSERRARAVRDYLIESGMPAERVVAEGFGHQRPAEPNTTGANMAANRRVAITFR
jgi:outer membrane protein OmpA-like peptidoglycan-associated protein